MLFAGTKETLKSILDLHAPVFSESLGRLEHINARISAKEGDQPRFWKARSVALARRPALERQRKIWREMASSSQFLTVIGQPQ